MKDCTHFDGPCLGDMAKCAGKTIAECWRKQNTPATEGDPVKLEEQRKLTQQCQAPAPVANPDQELRDVALQVKNAFSASLTRRIIKEVGRSEKLMEVQADKRRATIDIMKLQLQHGVGEHNDESLLQSQIKSFMEGDAAPDDCNDIRKALMTMGIDFDTAGKIMSRLVGWAGLHPATSTMIDEFANVLKAKLHAAQHKYGYSDDWKTKATPEQLRTGLLEYVAKGDPIDVAAFAAFLWARGEKTTDEDSLAMLLGTCVLIGPREDVSLISGIIEADKKPIDMVLHCPACGKQHIDAPEQQDPNERDFGMTTKESGLWTNPPHRSHLCQGCGHIWRPADVPTNGVEAVKTKGTADSPIAAPGATPPSAAQAEGAMTLAVAEQALSMAANEARLLSGDKADLFNVFRKYASAALTAAPKKPTGQALLMRNTFKHWFFKHLNEEQRMSLFRAAGLAVDEITSHTVEGMCLDHIVSRLIGDDGETPHSFTWGLFMARRVDELTAQLKKARGET